MHGREGEERKRKQHMWPVPAPGIAPAAPPSTAVASPSDSSQISSDFFIKGGRRIRVGDCALFQAGNAPPFIGIICSFATGKADYLTLTVNWLYRPADVKLAKGILLEAAPNEVFYSFHKDDNISVASLLHPCKVAFLRKGVELPPGISSFVCRRVYDIANKCLWWLNDQDYINERQEEVNLLLDRTRLEMHAAVQSGGRSPKPLNGPTSAQQLKSGSDSVQNSGTSFPSQVKGKKRERGDQSLEPIKRERSSKTEDGDSVIRLDNMIKTEIAKITDKGALVSADGVEKLVHLMQLDRVERKIDLASRALLADVIASTERFDCLGRFVQLRGVPVLDDWLQEAHKGKTGDGSSPKESDKSVEELLLALLRALDKLPVNLNALQTCNIGKSVNNLRGHKNLEIQKKARSLVDTWKKRVDAEMTKINDTKSVSSQPLSLLSKAGISELSHGVNRRAWSSEVTIKNPITQPSKPGHGDATVKPTTVTPGLLRLPSPLSASMAVSPKDSHGRTAGLSGTSELPLTAVKEEKSSSSSQSQNNSQSCSSDHAKTMGSSWKDDARSSTAGSMNAGKMSGGSSRHRRSGNGFLGTSVSGIQKEVNLGKSGSLNKTMTSDKVSQSGLTCEKPLDTTVADHGNTHRLIVRLPNRGRSPAQSASGGSFEDPSIMGSRASSPGGSDKHDHCDRKIQFRGDAYGANISTDVNTESWQSNDVKGLVGSDGGDRSPTALLEEECCRSADETGKATDISGAACSSSGSGKGIFLTEPKKRKSYEASFSSINALIESCAKVAEASALLSVGDDIGMNLLASVAAGEMSKSNLASPTESPRRSLPAPEKPCTGNEAKSRLLCYDIVAQSPGQYDDNANYVSEKHGKSAGVVLGRDMLQQTGTSFSGDSKTIMPFHENKLTGEQTEQSTVSGTCLHKTADACIKSEERADKCLSVSNSPADMNKDGFEGNGADQVPEKWNAGVQVTGSFRDCKPKVRSPSFDDECKVDGLVTDSFTDYKPEVRSPSDENKSIDCGREKIADVSTGISDFLCCSLGDGCVIENSAPGKPEKVVGGESPSCPADMDVKKLNVMDEGLSSATSVEHQLPSVVALHGEAVGKSGDDAAASPSDGHDESKAKKSDNLGVKSHLEPSDSERKDNTSLTASTLDDRMGSVGVSSSTNDGVGEILETMEVLEHHPVGSVSHEKPPTIPAQDTEKCARSTAPKMLGASADEREELASEASILVNTAGSGIASKLDFDLNEGFPGDEGNQGEPVTSAAPVCSSAAHLPSLSPFVASSLSSGSPTMITVAAPAKGPFVPPENLLKSKGEPGWKGSAATSAFRPAEPRKILEMPLSTSDIPSSDTMAVKQSRPPLEIDLNIPDERVMEDMVSQCSAQTTGSESGAISIHDTPIQTSRGLDLDLNRVDEGTENGQYLASTSRRLEMPLLPLWPASGGFPNEANVLRDFDLNGPGLDEVVVEPPSRSQLAKGSSMPFLPPIAGLRVNSAELANVSTWFPLGNSYSAVTIPSFLPDRREQPYPIIATAGPQRILGPATGGSTFGGDLYRGSVLSSSPAMAFSPAAAFPYAGLSFGSSFPLATTSFSAGSTTYVDSSSGGVPFFPTIPSQLMGPAGAVSSHYARPFVTSLPEASTSGGSESSQKWGKQSLDLNAGPRSADVEGRDDRLASASRQLSAATSQAFVEEQARIYQVIGGGSRRKETGGWDAERFASKHPSWQ